MTMPLQFNRSEYVRILRDAGIVPAEADAHADAIEAGLVQPVVLPSDLALLKAEILARMDERLAVIDVRLSAVEAKLKTLYVMALVSLILHAVTITKLFM